MKLKTLFIATSIILSTSTFAAINLNSSKSNTPQTNPDMSVAEKACVAGGGKVEVAKDGKKICVKQTPGTSMDSSTVKSSKSNSSD